MCSAVRNNHRPQCRYDAVLHVVHPSGVAVFADALDSEVDLMGLPASSCDLIVERRDAGTFFEDLADPLRPYVFVCQWPPVTENARPSSILGSDDRQTYAEDQARLRDTDTAQEGRSRRSREGGEEAVKDGPPEAEAIGTSPVDDSGGCTATHTRSGRTANA